MSIGLIIILSIITLYLYKQTLLLKYVVKCTSKMHNLRELYSKKSIGIIGGGQLGMMLIESTKKLSKYISKITVLDPNKNCPAFKVGAKQIIADYKNEQAIQKLAMESDIITYEIESGNTVALNKLRNKIKINPSPDTLKIIQDKFTQKVFLNQNNLPVSEFAKVDSVINLKKK